MRAYTFDQFDLDRLKMTEQPTPTPGPGEVLVDLRALSLNYRDLLVIRGLYNRKLALPATPVSDGAGVVAAIGDGVTRVKAGDPVVGHFVADWLDGPFRGEYSASSLGTPGAGLAAEQAVVPEHALVAPPAGYDFAQASTLPIAALTAWSALVTEGRLQAGQTILTLGTGGVSIWAVQLAKALGATAIITSSSDEKLERARALGADHGINYTTNADWEREVLALTDGRGVDVVVETGGAGTLNQSMKATSPGGTLAILGALTGLSAEVSTGTILMKRLTLAGIYVDCRRAFEEMNAFLSAKSIEPVIDQRFVFDRLPDALRTMEAGGHFGKIVVEV